jgi:hypothetical protein
MDVARAGCDEEGCVQCGCGVSVGVGWVVYQRSVGSGAVGVMVGGECGGILCVFVMFPWKGAGAVMVVIVVFWCGAGAVAVAPVVSRWPGSSESHRIPCVLSRWMGNTTISSFLPTVANMSGIRPKRHDTNMVCVWRHNPYVADMIFCVADTVDDMSLCRVDWAQKKTTRH